MSRLIDWLTKDNEGGNETNRKALSVRALALVLAFYFLASGIILFFSAHSRGGLICILYLCLMVLVIHLTYRGHTTAAHRTVGLAIYSWCILATILLGWNFGAQNYLFVLIVFVFISSYLKYRWKIALGMGVLATRIILSIYKSFYDPLLPFDDSQLLVLSIVNSVGMYACIILLVTFASQHSINMEKKLMRYNAEMKTLADHDQLTGLPNRRELYNRLNGDLAASSYLSIAIGDIDLFKHVNDTYGHYAGDEVLKVLAKLFQTFMKEHNGTCARWGGEEFLFVFNETNGDDAFLYLEQLRGKISNTEIRCDNGEKISVHMTFGLEEFVHGDDIDRAIKAADDKLYQGKQSGRNKVVY